MDSETRVLRCLNCKFYVQAHPTHPQVRCPECDVIGYPDRAGRNLVPIAWECPECGTRNDGMTNFCLECATGLATRCLKCEAAVYTAVCLHCGSHQDALLRLRTAATERENWVPLQRSHIEAEVQQVHSNRQPTPKPLPTEQAEPNTATQAAWQTLWPAMDRSMRQAAQARSQRIAQRRQQRRAARSGRDLGLSLLIVIFGIVLLLSQFREAVASGITAFSQSSFGQSIIIALADWWGTVTQISSGAVVDTSSPEYAAFFAITLFGVAAAPVIIYLLVRTIRRVI